jgi:hypothetical protein
MEQPDNQPGRLGTTNSEQLPAAGRSATPMATSGQLMEQPEDQPGRLGVPTPNNKRVHSRVIGKGWRDQAHFAVIWVHISARHFSSPPLP